MRFPRLLASLLVSLALLAAVPTTEASVRGSVTPRIGGPRETFVVRTIAPYPAYGD
jgi:hypothetical protein